MRLIAAIVVLTLIAIGAGALAGLHLFAAAERAADAREERHAAAGCVELRRQTARLRKLSPIVTNLAAPANNWARVEASMVTDSMSDEEAGILAAHISEDIVDLSAVGHRLRQFEGSRGLQHLRDDLTERANVRSSGKVRELIIETLVIQ